MPEIGHGLGKLCVVCRGNCYLSPNRGAIHHRSTLQERAMFSRLTYRVIGVRHIRPRAGIRLCSNLKDSSPPKLRDRQAVIVISSVDTLTSVRRALISAPTGYGKTAIFSSIISKIASEKIASVIPSTETRSSLIPFKAVVLSPTVELNRQNEDKFKKWNDDSLSTGIYGNGKHISTGDITFATYQTFMRDEHLENFPFVNLLVIDEAHRAPTDSYQKIIQCLLKGNPDMMILGLTATPSRADKKSLIKTFPEITFVVTLQEAIDEGVLVKPIFKTMVLKNTKEDEKLKDRLFELEVDEKGSRDDRYATLMDFEAANEAVVTHWKEQAGDRQTVVFCSTIEHAHHVTEAFKAAAVKVGLVHSQMSKPEREQCMQAYTKGEIQVIVNVAVLTEGWDDPPTSCVVLLRPCSNVNTWRQMIGRGMRASPGKNDCVVLDFGMSTKIHMYTPEVTGLEEGEEVDKLTTGNDMNTDECERDKVTPSHVLDAEDIEMKELTPSISLSEDTEQLSLASLPTASLPTFLGFKQIKSEYLSNVKKWIENPNPNASNKPLPQITTKWSFMHCAATAITEEDNNSTIMAATTTKTTNESHFVLVSIDAMVLVTRTDVSRDDIWMAICGENKSSKGKTFTVIHEGDLHTCSVKAHKWWKKHNHQDPQMRAMAQCKATEKLIGTLEKMDHHHLLVGQNLTKYDAMVILSLHFDRLNIARAINSVSHSQRRPPWRRNED